MSLCDRVPNIQRELNGEPHEHINCGPSAVRWLVRFSSCGVLRPTSEDIRERGAFVSGTGNIFKFKVAFDSFRPDAAAHGLDWPTMVIRSPHGDGAPIFRPASELFDLGPDEAAAIIGVYHVINVKRPEFSGDPNYHGPHVVPYHQGQIYDGLYDGRRAGIPDTPKAWGQDLLRDFLAAFPRSGTGSTPVGLGFGVFGTAPRAKRLTRRPGKMVPEVTAEEYAAAIGERDAAQAALGTIKDLATTIGWQGLAEMAAAGLPTPNTTEADAVIDVGVEPATDDQP